MKNKDKITLLKAKVIKLKEQLKSAQKTCAKQDNEIDMLKETIRCHVENNQLVAQVLMDKNKVNPIESTQELFEGKGYVYINYPNGVKMYVCPFGYIDDKNQAIEFYSFEQFKKTKHPDLEGDFHFEPIQ